MLLRRLVGAAYALTRMQCYSDMGPRCPVATWVLNIAPHMMLTQRLVAAFAELQSRAHRDTQIDSLLASQKDHLQQSCPRGPLPARSSSGHCRRRRWSARRRKGRAAGEGPGRQPRPGAEPGHRPHRADRACPQRLACTRSSHFPEEVVPIAICCRADQRAHKDNKQLR